MVTTLYEREILDMIMIDFRNYIYPPPLLIKGCTGHIHLGLILDPFMVSGDISIWAKYSLYDNDSPLLPIIGCTEHTYMGVLCCIPSWLMVISAYEWNFLDQKYNNKPYIARSVAEIPFTCVKDIVHTEVKITASQIQRPDVINMMIILLVWPRLPPMWVW